jgi:hypothetical protein
LRVGSEAERYPKQRLPPDNFATLEHHEIGNGVREVDDDTPATLSDRSRQTFGPAPSEIASARDIAATSRQDEALSLCSSSTRGSENNLTVTREVFAELRTDLVTQEFDTKLRHDPCLINSSCSFLISLGLPLIAVATTWSKRARSIDRSREWKSIHPLSSRGV